MLENKEQEKIAGIISDFFDGVVAEADIDILAMKIYEKYVAKLEQDLEFTTKTANELIEIKHKLKQELAELKEKDNYHLRYELAGADETITNLKEQLAEKDIRIEELEGQFAYECECNKQLVELQKQLTEKQNTIDEINKEFVQAVHDWKALCAEKDKEIEDMDKDLVFNANEIKRLIQEKKRLKQNQTQLAITELEKVKNTLKHFCNIHSDEYYGVKAEVKGIELDVCESIDYQIKALKGNNDEPRQSN